jgi:hypothetical protein
MAIYAAAMIVSIMVARNGRIHVAAPLLVGLVGLVWAAGLAWGVPDLATYSRMFEQWEMKNTLVEEAREASGLLLVVAWMGIVVVAGSVARR